MKRVAVTSRGARFWAAVEAEKPLQVAGAINAYTARWLRRRVRALYLSARVAAIRWIADLASAPCEDVLTDVRRHHRRFPAAAAGGHDTGGRSVQHCAGDTVVDESGRGGGAHRDQASAKRCAIARQGTGRGEEMVDRIKARGRAQHAKFAIMAD